MTAAKGILRLHFRSSIYGALLLCVPFNTVARAQLPAPPTDEVAGAKPALRITISKETTWITQPLRDDGYADFARFLDDKLSAGVTPDNNAAVFIWKAMGPEPIKERHREAFFRRLGIPDVEESETTFIDWFQFFGPLPQVRNNRFETLGEQLGKRYDRASQRPWVAKDDPDLARWLDKNEAALGLMVEASKRGKYYNPIGFADEPSLEYGFLVTAERVRIGARALIIRAMLRAGENKPDKAWDDILAVFRLGRLVARGPTMMDLQTGAGIESTAAAAATELFRRHEITAETLARVQKGLEELPARPRLADAIDLGERLHFCNVVCLHARRGMKQGEKECGVSFTRRAGLPAFVFDVMTDWNVTLREGNKRYDCLVAALRRPTRNQRITAVSEYGNDWGMLATALERAPSAFDLVFNLGSLLRTRINNAIVFELLPWTDLVHSAMDAEDRADACHRLIQLAGAINKHRAANNRFPMALSDLSPKQLGKVPQDPYSDAAFIYLVSANGYKLYSVGPNGEDEGGAAQSDDIVVGTAESH